MIKEADKGTSFGSPATLALSSPLAACIDYFCFSWALKPGIIDCNHLSTLGPRHCPESSAVSPAPSPGALRATLIRIIRIIEKSARRADSNVGRGYYTRRPRLSAPNPAFRLEYLTPRLLLEQIASHLLRCTPSE